MSYELVPTAFGALLGNTSEPFPIAFPGSSDQVLDVLPRWAKLLLLVSQSTMLSIPLLDTRHLEQGWVLVSGI